MGCLRIELFIYVKELLFMRSIAVLDPESIYRSVMVNQLYQFRVKYVVSRHNSYHSPAFDIFKIAEMFGLQEQVYGMICGTIFFHKRKWKEIVWKRAWELENYDWTIRTNLFSSTRILKGIMENVEPLLW